MAKKFGKFIFFTAAAGAAAAAVHYYLQKKKAENTESDEEDYDDFGGDSQDSQDSQTYVPLHFDAKTESTGEEAAQAAPEKDGFTPLKDSVEHASAKADEPENVEEFFDEEDSSDTEPPIDAQ